MIMEEKHIAFIIREEDQGIDSIVYVHLRDKDVIIRTSQLLENLRDVVIPYVLLHYTSHVEEGHNDMNILYSDGETDLQKLYMQYKDNVDTVEGGTVRTLQEMLDDVAGYYMVDLSEDEEIIKPDSRMTDYFVPPFKDMNDERFRAWMDYFMSRGLDEESYD